MKVSQRKLTGRRGAETETPARWKLAEVPSGAAQVNECQASRAKCQVEIVTLEHLTLLVAWDATPALAGEPIVEISFRRWR